MGLKYSVLSPPFTVIMLRRCLTNTYRRMTRHPNGYAFERASGSGSERLGSRTKNTAAVGLKN